jgi:hypothetical protein
VDFLKAIAFPDLCESAVLRTESLWCHALDEVLAPGYIGQRKIVRELGSGIVRSATPIYVVSASVIGDWAIFSWKVGTNGGANLTMIDLRNGECIWTKRGRSSLLAVSPELLFASARFVILAGPSSAEPRTFSFELLDSATGSLTVRLSEKQFRMIVCPDWKKVLTTPYFQRSNVTMVDSTTAFKRSAVRSNSKGLMALLGKLTPINHGTVEFYDTSLLRDPFGLTPYSLQIKNVWRHVHAVGEYPYYQSECFLSCRSLLECVSQVSSL